MKTANVSKVVLGRCKLVQVIVCSVHALKRHSVYETVFALSVFTAFMKYIFLIHDRDLM